MMIEKVLFVKHFKSKKDLNQRFIGLLYTVRGILSNQDILDADSAYESLIHGDRVGPFESKDELITFCHSLSARYKLHGICLCDEEIINKAFSDIRQISKLNHYLFENADIIENPQPRKKGIFSSILGD